MPDDEPPPPFWLSPRPFREPPPMPPPMPVDDDG